MLFVSALVLPIWCCFLRSTSAETSGLDLFQPGTIVALFYYLYVVIPAFHVWHDLGYHSDWTDPTWPARRLFQLTMAVSLLGLIAFGVGYHANTSSSLTRRDQWFTRAPATWPPAATPLALAMLVM